MTKHIILTLFLLCAVLIAGAQKTEDTNQLYTAINGDTVTLLYGHAPAETETLNYLSDWNFRILIIDKSVKKFEPTSCKEWFDNLDVEEIIGLENINTENVTDMSEMFRYCSRLKTLDMSSFDTKNVINMSRMFEGCSSLTTLDVSSFNTTNVTNMQCMFQSCGNLTTLDVSNFDTHNVTDMSGMFYWCGKLNYLDLSNFDTHNVTDMREMFRYCISLKTLDLSNFDTKNVTNMSYMFDGCFKLQSLNVSSFNTANVTNMKGMFGGCRLLRFLDISNFNTEAVADMDYMFRNCISLRAIYVGGSFNTIAASNAASMFAACWSLYGEKGSHYDAEHKDKTYAVIDNGKNHGYFTLKGHKAYVPKAYAVFKDSVLSLCYGDNRPEEYLYIGCYEDKRRQIKEVVFDKSFKNYLPTSCSGWFGGLINLTTITGMADYLNTSNVTDMSFMFDGTDMEFIDISGFNTSKVTNMNYMFRECFNLRAIYAGNGWNTKNVKSAKSIFSACNLLCGGKGSSGYKLRDLEHARIDSGKDKPGLFTQAGQQPYIKKTAYKILKDSVLTFYFGRQPNEKQIFNRRQYQSSEVKRIVIDSSYKDYYEVSFYDYNGMDFSNFENLTEIAGLEYLNTDSVKNMSGLFSNCPKLRVLDLSHFNTAKVEDMSGMFRNCSSLQDINLGNFNTSNVTDMSGMFLGCTNLKQLDVSSFDTKNVTDMSSMFSGCTSLKELDLGSFSNASISHNIDRMFHNCHSLTTIYVGDAWKPLNFNHNPNDYFYYPDGGVFNNCYLLIGGQGTRYAHGFSYSTPDDTLARIDGGRQSPGYFTAKGNKKTFPTPYAVLNDGTLTFHYGNDVPQNAYLIDGVRHEPQWHRETSQIRKVVFDDSFRNFRPTSCYEWFSGCCNLTEIVGMGENLNTEDVVDMGAMFFACVKLQNIDVSTFKTGNVANMNSMFSGCTNATAIDVSGFDTHNVTRMAHMFDGCMSLASLNLKSFNTEKVRSMSAMFQGCKSLKTMDVSNFNMKSCYYVNSMFSQCTGLKSISGLNFEFGEGFHYTIWMFEGCKSLKSLDVSGIKNISYQKGMFHGCSGLKSITLFAEEKDEDYDYVDLRNAQGLFYGCSNLKSIDLTQIGDKIVSCTPSYMFANCTKLKTIYCNNWNSNYRHTMTIENRDGMPEEKVIENVHDFTNMFQNCPKLIGGKDTKWTKENASNMDYLRVDGGTDAPGFFTSKEH